MIFTTVHKWTVQLDNTWCQPSLSFVNETSPIFRAVEPCQRPLASQEGHGKVQYAGNLQGLETLQ